MKTISRRKKIAVAVFAAVLLLLIALFILIWGKDRLAEITKDNSLWTTRSCSRSIAALKKETSFL